MGYNNTSRGLNETRIMEMKLIKVSRSDLHTRPIKKHL